MKRRIFGFVFFLAFCIEISSIIIIGQYIGVLRTLFLLFLNMIIGTSLIAKSGRDMIRRIQKELTQKHNPDQTIVSGFIMFLAGVLFCIPGFISDILAVVLLIPMVQSHVWIYIKKYVSIDTKNYNSGFSSFNDDIIIDLDQNDYHHQNDEKHDIKYINGHKNTKKSK